MRKYIIKNADGSEQTVMQAIHNSRKEAGRELMRYLSYHNESWDVDNHLSPFDFVLEEVECGDINEVITDFESAREMLGLKALGFLNKFDDVTKLISDINPKHVKTLIALNELFTIAEAWNEADGFVPDFSDWNQDKWFPWFEYNKNVAGFVYATTGSTPTAGHTLIGSRLCFNTSERAKQFGKQFADLYNKVFL
nr:MAG TPA: hypothetical protein [Caudoviricetes sp.]